MPDPSILCLDHIAVEEDVIVFHGATIARGAPCPACGNCSQRIHSHYQRTLQDLPWQGNTVRFLLTVPKYFCDNKDCPRKIFAQRIARIAQRYRRKTARLDDLLQRLTWQIGAAEAARLARLLGLILSPDAALYRFKRSACPQSPGRAPEVLGIDDFAFRRGHSYGTILIDLKTRTPVDLLPDRERASVEKWLREHPGARTISRDRSAIYADAIREAAPEVTAVADRFHVLKNLMETFQTQIGKENKTIRAALIPQTASLEDAGPVTQARRVQRRSQESRQSRLERWQKVHDLFGQSYFKKEIARMTGLDIRTVRHYLRDVCAWDPCRHRGGACGVHSGMEQRADGGERQPTEVH